MQDQAPYGIVGNGRTATHLRHYVEGLGIPHISWSRGTEAKTAGSPVEVLRDCPTILLLISDHAIEPFVRAWPGLRTKTLVHFSGCLCTDLAIGIHPLMTFGPRLYDLSLYPSIPFMVESPPGDHETFRKIFPALENPHYLIPAGLKPLYHALCVMSGNFPTLLWQKCAQEFEKRLSLPFQVLHPYLQQVWKNFLNSPQEALTGPLARDDRQTLQQNLDSLRGDSFGQVYQAFVRAYDQERDQGKRCI